MVSSEKSDIGTSLDWAAQLKEAVRINKQMVRINRQFWVSDKTHYLWKWLHEYVAQRRLKFPLVAVLAIILSPLKVKFHYCLLDLMYNA